MSYFAIGVDLGGTNLRVAAIDVQGRILKQIRLRTDVRAGREAVLREISAAVDKLRAPHSSEARLAGIGLGVPGIIYAEEGRIRESPNLPGWRTTRSVRKSNKAGRPGIPRQRRQCAALGEKWMGLGRDVDSLAMLTLGTGVGGGVVQNGRIWHGFLGMAGEFGHITVSPDGPRCGCTNHGCLEQMASATAIVRMGP